MEFVNLGRSGLKVSRLCLGTMVFGSQCDERESFAILDCADELGFNFIDTADAYPVPPDLKSAGRTEEIIGSWLRGRRERFVLATKFTNAMGPGPNDVGGSRKHVIEACEASLRRLGTDRVDLYYIHRYDDSAPVDETMDALDHLVRDGKVLYVGISNYAAWQLALAYAHVRERGLAPVVAIQPRLNLLARQPERDLLPLCRAAGIGVMPYNPLGAGMLTGKYRRSAEAPEGSRFSWGEYGTMYRGRYWSDRMFDLVEILVEVARAEGVSAAQAAIAWTLTREAVTAPVIGASRPDQLRETAASVDVHLSNDAVARLEEASSLFA